METKIKSASVKVMLSVDYNHFEASMTLENDEGLNISEIDSARKDCQRLTDKAAKQYWISKELARKRVDGKYKIENMEAQVGRIILKAEGDRTINEIAMLKQFQDEDWQAQFEFPYDYEDEYIEINNNKSW